MAGNHAAVRFNDYAVGNIHDCVYSALDILLSFAFFISLLSYFSTNAYVVTFVGIVFQRIVQTKNSVELTTKHSLHLNRVC